MVNEDEPKGAWLQKLAAGAHGRLEEERRLYGRQILLPAVNEMLDEGAAADQPPEPDVPSNVTHMDDFRQKKKEYK